MWVLLIFSVLCSAYHQSINPSRDTVSGRKFQQLDFAVIIVMFLCFFWFQVTLHKSLVLMSDLTTHSATCLAFPVHRLMSCILVCVHFTSASIHPFIHPCSQWYGFNWPLTPFVSSVFLMVSDDILTLKVLVATIDA